MSFLDILSRQIESRERIVHLCVYDDHGSARLALECIIQIQLLKRLYHEELWRK